ncbi:hypothetical protein Tco_1372923 [Tanacetum coccineum]
MRGGEWSEKEGRASNKEDDQNVQDFRVALDNLLVQQKEGYANSTNSDSTISPSVSAVREVFTNANDLPTDSLMPDLEDTANLLNTGMFSGAYDDEDVGAKVDLNNLETTMNVNPIPTTRIYKDHPKDQIIGDINSATQTRRMTKISKELAMSRMDGRTCNIKQKCVKSQIPKRGRDTKIPQSGGPLEKVGDEAVHKELGDRMERAATTASSLEAEQDNGSGPRCQDTILGGVDAQTRIGVDTARHKLNTASIKDAARQSFTNANDLLTDPFMPDLEDTDNLLNTGIFSGANDDEYVGAEADLNNLENTVNVSLIPTTRIYKDHPKDQIIRDINSASQTRSMRHHLYCKESSVSF